ncbi:MAG: ANTAR domain-containing protein [Gammaproteobacteria bacterium]|nr:ANTAR domain-containing protein [Gammaproteobacteria bacterium]
MLKILLVAKGGNSAVPNQLLTCRDYQVRKIGNPSGLLNHVREFNPDAVVVISDSPDGQLLAGLQAVNRSIPVPVALIAPELESSSINDFIQAGANTLILDNPEHCRLDGMIQAAIAQFKQLQALKTALENAYVQLEDRKKIDRAKAILIKTRNLSEEDAYHTLRKLAMQRNMTMGEVARHIIALADLFK